MQTNLADFIKDTPAGREADAILRTCTVVSVRRSVRPINCWVTSWTGRVAVFT